jgi:hypothetical protein
MSLAYSHLAQAFAWSLRADAGVPAFSLRMRLNCSSCAAGKTYAQVRLQRQS